MPELAICLGVWDDQKVDQALRGLGSDPRFSAWFAGRPDREEHPLQVECSLETFERQWGEPLDAPNSGFLWAVSDSSPDPVWALYLCRHEETDWISIEPPDWDPDDDWGVPEDEVTVEWFCDLAATLLTKCPFHFAMILPSPFRKRGFEDREHQAFIRRGVPDQRPAHYLVADNNALRFHAHNIPWWTQPSRWSRLKEWLS